MFSKNTADLKSITNLTVSEDVAISVNLYVFYPLFCETEWVQREIIHEKGK